MHRAALATLVLALGAVSIGGCGLTPIEPDAGVPGQDGMSPTTDAELPTSVLRLVFTSDPKIPGDAGGRHDATITTVQIGLQDLRAISDNASPSVPALRLDWGDQYDPDEIPVDFDDAPPGIYSRVRAKIEDISITGTVTIGGEIYDYIISGEPRSASVTVDLTSVMLSGTQMTSVPIQVDVKEAIRDVSWTALEPMAVGNTIILPDSLLGDFASQLAGSFGQDE